MKMNSGIHSFPLTTFSVIIATFGDDSWIQRAWTAADSVEMGDCDELIVNHTAAGTLAQSRNEGAAQATKNRLVFLDADDSLAPGYLEAMREGWQRSVYEAKDYPSLLVPRVSYGRAAPRYWPEVDMKHGNWLVIGTSVPRPLFEKVGGFREYNMYEDWDLFARCVMDGASLFKVPEAIYRAAVSTSSRNRAPSIAEKVYWHQEIGFNNWPEIYEEPTAQERLSHQLVTRQLRKVA